MSMTWSAAALWWRSWSRWRWLRLWWWWSNSSRMCSSWQYSWGRWHRCGGRGSEVAAIIAGDSTGGVTLLSPVDINNPVPALRELGAKRPLPSLAPGSKRAGHRLAGTIDPRFETCFALQTPARGPHGIDLGPPLGDPDPCRGGAAAAHQGATDPVDDYGVRLSVKSRADERRTLHKKTASPTRRCRLCDNAERTEKTGRQSNSQHHRRLHCYATPSTRASS